MAETETQPPAEEQVDVNALETPENDTNALEEPGDGSREVIDATDSSGQKSASDLQPEPPKKQSGIKAFTQRFNIYLLLFVFILAIAGIIIVVAYFQSKKASTTSTIKTQDLTQAALEQVANSDATVGNSQQILNVQSSAVFAGKVLVREGLEVAGNLQIGGTVAVNNLTVSGSSQFGQVQINKDLAVAGDSGFQGSVTVAKSLQVNGGGNFAGPVTAPQITTSVLQINGDLVFTKHLVAGGPTPGRSSGSALGSGGSVSISGSDTAGTVSINTGGSPPAGCFVTVNFTSRYNSIPHILLTPVGSSGGSIDYYVNRTTSSFSICDSTSPPAGSSFGFDYFVID